MSGFIRVPGKGSVSLWYKQWMHRREWIETGKKSLSEYI